MNEPMTIIERLRNPAWKIGPHPFVDAVLETVQTRATMEEAANKIEKASDLADLLEKENEILRMMLLALSDAFTGTLDQMPFKHPQIDRAKEILARVRPKLAQIQGRQDPHGH